MKDSGEAIDRVLAGLREVEAPVGMERRIMEGVEARAAVRGRRWMPVAGFVLAGGAALVMAGVLVGYRSESEVPVRASPPQTVGLSEMGHPESVAGVGLASPPQTVGLSEMGHRESGAGEGRSFAGRKRYPTLSMKPKGWATREMSMVAPPMPLTEQEKLLVQVARRGDPEKLAVFDPDGLARGELMAEARFRALSIVENDVEHLGEKQ